MGMSALISVAGSLRSFALPAAGCFPRRCPLRPKLPRSRPNVTPLPPRTRVYVLAPHGLRLVSAVICWAGALALDGRLGSSSCPSFTFACGSRLTTRSPPHRYEFQFWRNKAKGMQKMVRNGVETTITRLDLVRFPNSPSFSLRSQFILLVSAESPTFSALRP
jgi:hypothetical protein